MKRGEIWLVQFDPVQGSEANKTRPALIISNDHANTAANNFSRGTVTVIPITSNISRIFKFQAFLPAKTTGLPKDSKAQPEQIRSVSVDRLSSRVGIVDADLMREIEQALLLHLNIDGI